MSEALQARALEPARCTPARGCCNQCVPCTRTQTRTDARRHMHQRANLSPVVSEEPRPHLACQLPQPARIAKASFLQCGFQTCSRRSLRPSKKREARQMLENWRRRDFQNFASENKARCKLRESTAEPRPMPEGVTARVAPDREQRVKAPGSEDRRLETAAGERGHDRLKRSRR